MIYIYPDFYFDFECRADKCEHTCCKDWEIDVDDEALERFSMLKKPESDSVIANISFDESPHFLLHADGRCPFLEQNGLCRLIKNYGQDFVPYICREHPRFYNEYNSVCECGLGLSCEETVSLILDEAYLDFIFQDDNEDDVDTKEKQFIEEKYNLIDDIAECDDSVLPAVSKYNLCSDVSFNILYNAFFNIETLSPVWQNMLKGLSSSYKEKTVHLSADRTFTAFSQYLIFRHLTDDNQIRIALFTACAVSLCSILVENGNSIENVIREFSSEIEYSDENIDRIINALMS